MSKIQAAPGRPGEDTRGGFSHGGWAAPYDAMQSREAAPDMSNLGALLARRTYEDLYGYWPKQTGSPFTAALNDIPKYVASTTLKEPLAWRNSTSLKGDVPAAVAKLKQQPGKDLVIMGSGELVRSLMQHNLIDAYMLLTHPVVLGAGLRLFDDSNPVTTLRLVEAKSTDKGVVVATFVPDTSALGKGASDG